MSDLGIPGFVDLQINGCQGVDFSSMEVTEDDLVRAFRWVLSNGTAGFLATLITSPRETYARNLPLIAHVIARGEFRGKVLGIHLEGPFISARPGAVGAHNADWVCPPDIPYLAELLEWAAGRVRLLTLAADVPGADELASVAVEKGVVVSVGHSMFTPDDLTRLSGVGATALTHLGNGLPNELPRLASPIWAGLAADGLTAMLIADGHHLPPPTLKAMIRAKGVANVVVVSDAASVSGLVSGRYRVHANDVVLEPSGLLHIPAKGCLAGSSATMLQCMNTVASLRAFDTGQMLAMGFTNPLRLIGVSPKDLTAETALTYDEAASRFAIRE